MGCYSWREVIIESRQVLDGNPRVQGSGHRRTKNNVIVCL